MEKYKLRFFFEYGGIGDCLWSSNDVTYKEFGFGSLDLELLPLSDDLKTILYDMSEEYQSSLDWNYPPNPSPWSEEHKKDFLIRSKQVYQRLVLELGDDFEVQYCFEKYN